MIAKVKSASCVGIEAYPIDIEVDVANGLPQFQIVGLPDPSVKEAKERVRAAIKNSGYRFPPEKITVNLAPADIRKEGPAFDLPIALGILAASGVIPQENFQQFAFLGELALDGSLRPFKGAIVITSHMKRSFSFILPEKNAAEAGLEKDCEIYSTKNLKEVVQFLLKEISLPSAALVSKSFHPKPFESYEDFSEVKGQPFAKRAIEIAVAGGHNLILIGSPGAGKTMLARRVPSILPPLEFEEALEMTKIYSVAGLLGRADALITQRPFRDPHYSISPVAMIGGGTWPKPGEVSLAHGGVLFLDEFPEFRRDVLEALRTPLEDGKITIARAKQHVAYPARICLIAAMNPCPCGFLSDPSRACRCSLSQIQKYQLKVSGPILDRIDLHVEVPPVSYGTLSEESHTENSNLIRTRILECRNLQKDRFKDRKLPLNALMLPRDIKKYVGISSEGKYLLERAMKELRLSARGYYKILKMARTIADLAREDLIASAHIAEAIQYRSLDRLWWQ